ncbi:hypothetical protein BsWGS_08346 [Bradybaena similaris]
MIHKLALLFNDYRHSWDARQCYGVHTLLRNSLLGKIAVWVSSLGEEIEHLWGNNWTKKVICPLTLTLTSKQLIERQHIISICGVTALCSHYEIIIKPLCFGSSSTPIIRST